MKGPAPISNFWNISNSNMFLGCTQRWGGVGWKFRACNEAVWFLSRWNTGVHTHFPVTHGYPSLSATPWIRDSESKPSRWVNLILNTPRVVLCAPQSYCRFLCTLECHTGWCAWAEGSGQVPINTVCTPPIFWFRNRLPKSAKILISQSSVNFLYSALNESNSKTTKKNPPN